MTYLEASSQPLSADLVEPLSITDEQAEILRHVTRAAAGKSSIRIEDVSMSDWELRLLKSEALAARDVRDTSLTLLRARAAELRLRRWLSDCAARDLDSSEAAARLLDRTLADIGSAADDPTCSNADGLEEIARGLDELYGQVAGQSLRLVGTGAREPAAPVGLEEFDADSFELEDPRELPFLRLVEPFDDTSSEVPLSLGAEPHRAVGSHASSQVAPGHVVRPAELQQRADVVTVGEQVAAVAPLSADGPATPVRTESVPPRPVGAEARVATSVPARVPEHSVVSARGIDRPLVVSRASEPVFESPTVESSLGSGVSVSATVARGRTTTRGWSIGVGILAAIATLMAAVVAVWSH